MEPGISHLKYNYTIMSPSTYKQTNSPCVTAAESSARGTGDRVRASGTAILPWYPLQTLCSSFTETGGGEGTDYCHWSLQRWWCDLWAVPMQALFPSSTLQCVYIAC